MAWIKMRTDLWDDPRVAAMCDRAELPEATVVGGLYRLWSIADGHTLDGRLPGMTKATVDRKTGIKGFGEAVEAVGWLAFDEEGASIVRFDEHNGASAKRRAQEAKRMAFARDANKKRTGRGHGANAERTEIERDAKLEKEVEEEREKENCPNGHSGPDGPVVPRKPSGWSAADIEEGKAVLAAWNALPDVTGAITPLSEARKKSLRARLRDPFWRGNWRRGMEAVEASDFCRGKVKDWRATLDWFLKPKTLTRLIEGQYATAAPRAGPLARVNGGGTRTSIVNAYLEKFGGRSDS